MKNILFIVNPSAGKKHIKSKLFEIIDIFTKADYSVRVYPTQGPGDAMEIIMKEGMLYDILACAGGDGTLDDVVTGCMKSGCDTPIGYIPAGTINDFARSLSIPKDPIIAAKRIVSHQPSKIDVGSFNGNYFAYVAAFGAFTEASYATSQRLKNYFGQFAYVLEGIKSLPSIKAYNMTIEYDGKTVTGEFMYGMITNSLSVGGLKSLTHKSVQFDDGLFEALFIKQPSNPVEMQTLMTSLMKNEINEACMYDFKARHIKVYSDEKVPWTLDGEFGGEHDEVEILNHQQAIEIIRK